MPYTKSDLTPQTARAPRADLGVLPFPYEGDSLAGLVCVGVLSGASCFERLFRDWARITKMVMLQRSIGNARELRLEQRVPRL